MTFMKERKAISPVIATVILVAVAITVAVGVSYWMSGISSQYTQFEKVEIQTGYATFTAEVAPAPAYWTITLSIKNGGSATATLTHVFVNDVPVTYGTAVGVAGTVVAEVDTTHTLPLEPGASGEVNVWIAAGGALGDPAFYLSSGTTVNVKLHSAGGMDYIKLIRLP